MKIIKKLLFLMLALAFFPEIIAIIKKYENQKKRIISYFDNKTRINASRYLFNDKYSAFGPDKIKLPNAQELFEDLEERYKVQLSNCTNQNQIIKKSENLGRQIGTYYYTRYALEQMQQRKINSNKVAWTIGHGNRYRTHNRGIYFIANLEGENNLGIVFDYSRNIVITAFSEINSEKIQKWIEKRDNASKEEKLASIEKYKFFLKQYDLSMATDNNAKIKPNSKFIVI